MQRKVKFTYCTNEIGNIDIYTIITTSKIVLTSPVPLQE